MKSYSTISSTSKAASSSTSRKSASLPPETVDYLKAWMMSPEHIAHPYPTEQEKAQIRLDTGIELKQLTNWFVNNRKRYWKPRMEQGKKQGATLSMLQHHPTQQQQQQVVAKVVVPPSSSSTLQAYPSSGSTTAAASSSSSTSTSQQSGGHIQSTTDHCSSKPMSPFPLIIFIRLECTHPTVHFHLHTTLFPPTATATATASTTKARVNQVNINTV